MIPIKAKTLIEEVSKELNIPEQDLRDITNFYWDDVYDTLRNIEHTRVYIEQLGEFKVKHWLLTKKILEYTQKISANPGKTFIQKLIKEEHQELLNKMINLQSQFVKEYELKQTKKTLRDEFKRNKKDLEE